MTEWQWRLVRRMGLRFFQDERTSWGRNREWFRWPVIGAAHPCGELRAGGPKDRARTRPRLFRWGTAERFEGRAS